MKRLILGVEIDETDIAKLLEDDTPKNENFNNSYFKDQLNELEKTIEILSKAGSEFVSEYIQLKRLFDGLSKVEEWFSKYNYTDTYSPVTITRVTKLIQIKAFIPGIKYMSKQHFIKVDGSGVFAPVEMYIIPFQMIEGNFETPLDCLRHVSLSTGISTYGVIRNPFNLPLDALYGSTRELSDTHFAVICSEQENPIAKFLDRNISWRYILSNGSSL